MFNILIDNRTIFLIPYLLLKGLQKDPLNICELFWNVKMEDGIFGKIQINRDTRQAHILHQNYNLFDENHPSTKLKK